MIDGRATLVSRIKKYWRKKREVRYTFMLVPRGSGVTKSINIPFFIIVLFFLLFAANIYFLVRYPLRLSEIDNLDRKVYQLNDVIARNDNDLKLIDPSIKKTEEFEAIVAQHSEIIKQIEALHRSILDKKAGKF
ncbi:hypothetical protein [Capillibacterium thermochitinicola]|uniref:Uncharacterized protein n=1 Tax=Capillibacterium thermochitinicola TaxID=2699427 RepID=A0A8J6I0W6_9FIRM|nr:hypothetical protein [Capillibacterium thermochitinicola]MBA2133228.1 hypothetical protein [Capillibacterium thermochitinicola]